MRCLSAVAELLVLLGVRVKSHGYRIEIGKNEDNEMASGIIKVIVEVTDQYRVKESSEEVDSRDTVKHGEMRNL